MRFQHVLLFVFCLLMTGSAVAGELSPGLQAYMADKSNNDSVKALLILNDQVDIPTLDLTLHFQKETLAHRHFQVITALQEKAKDTQGPLLADLEARRQAGQILGYKSYWLINAVLVNGPADEIRSLTARSDIDIAELDLKTELIEPTSSRPVEGKSRGIGITPGVKNIGARRVWDELGIRGEGALIASLDTGVRLSHEALADRWRGNHAPASECWLDVLGNGTTSPVDNHGHGTHTTGTMTGVAEDDTIGVAPGSEWIACNAIDQGAGSELDSDVLDAFEFFTDPDGDPGTLDDVPDVVQNSWGVSEDFSGYYDCDSRWWAALDACEAAGVVLCFSAGNSGPGSQSMGSPADRSTTLYNSFSVGSTITTAPYTISGFSSRGPAGPNCGPVENRVKPEICAPGSDVYSADHDGTYSYKDGTSMSGPHVAGVVALMRSANPNLDVITIKQVIMDTAIDLGVAGEDNTYGHGFIDAYQCVASVMGGLGQVEGYVTDGVSGDPIANAQITISNGPQSTTTDAAGYYSLTLPVGDLDILVSSFGYQDGSASTSILEDQTVTQNLGLTRVASATLSGYVFAPGVDFPGQTGVADVVVKVTNAPVAPVTTDADGYYAFILPVGADYDLLANLTGIGSLVQTVPMPADLRADLYLSPLSGDDFETGDFSRMPWQHGGDADWTVDGSTGYQSDHAAKTGGIGNSSNTDLTITVDGGGEMSFWYKVSTEEDYDYLRFYVDNQQEQSWSGEVNWSQFTLTLSPGTHTLKWSYDKDWGYTGGSDCAWIDDVVLPVSSTPEPRFVMNPATDVEVDGGTQTTAQWLVMNQGPQSLTFDAVPPAGGNISLTNGYGTIAPRGYQLVDATYDAVGVSGGQYSEDITVTTNEPSLAVLTVQALYTVISGATGVGDLPMAFALQGAAPNPFNPSTTLHYTLPTSGSVDLRLYDVQGRLVKTLVTDIQSAGENSARWDGRDNSGRSVASGTYFVRLRAGSHAAVKPIVLVR